MVVISMKESQVYALSFILSDIDVGKNNAYAILDVYSKFKKAIKSRLGKQTIQFDIDRFLEKNNIKNLRVYKTK